MGRHSATNSGISVQSVPVAAGRTPASTSFGTRKKEIERLDAENARLFADNQEMYAANIALNGELQRLRADFARIDGLGIVGREQEKDRLDALIAKDKAAYEEQQKKEAAARENEEARHRNELSAIEQKIAELKTLQLSEEAALVNIREVRALNDVSMYDYENDAEDSLKLKEKLTENKQKQKRHDPRQTRGDCHEKQSWHRVLQRHVGDGPEFIQCRS